MTMAQDRAKKILTVDDDRHVVRQIQVNLERAGYRVVTAFDGREALEKVEVEKPDLIVLDVLMPHLDGFEVLKRLRSDPQTCRIPVLMLSARAQEAPEDRPLGVSGYLTKPFSPFELVASVQRLLAAPAMPGDEANGAVE